MLIFMTKMCTNIDLLAILGNVLMATNMNFEK